MNRKAFGASFFYWVDFIRLHKNSYQNCIKQKMIVLLQSSYNSEIFHHRGQNMAHWANRLAHLQIFKFLAYLEDNISRNSLLSYLVYFGSWIAGSTKSILLFHVHDWSRRAMSAMNCPKFCILFLLCFCKKGKQISRNVNF